jgi:hypothetical protein
VDLVAGDPLLAAVGLLPAVADPGVPVDRAARADRIATT